MSGTERPRVLLAVPDARSRLRVVEALRKRFDLVPLAQEEDPLRGTRTHRPALVLLAVPRGRTASTLRACRAIKTDAGTPPRVALLDPRARLLEPNAAIEASQADAYLGREVDDAQLVAFVNDTLAGKRPVIAGEPRPRTLLERLLRR